MICDTLDKGEFHHWMTKRLVSLIPKDGDLNDLEFWRHITLLTVAYNFLPKAMQFRLHISFMEVVSLEQSIFLPLQFILDNIVMVQRCIGPKLLINLLYFLNGTSPKHMTRYLGFSCLKLCVI